MIDANRLVDLLEREGQLAHPGDVPRQVRQRPGDIRMVGAHRPPAQVKRALVECARPRELSARRHDFRERVDPPGHVRMIRAQGSRPDAHGFLLQPLGFGEVANFSREKRLVVQHCGGQRMHGAQTFLEADQGALGKAPGLGVFAGRPQ